MDKEIIRRIRDASKNSDKGSQSNRKRNDRILVVDGLNTFLRCFTVSPAMNEDGHHVGGLTGFLKSLGYAIRKLDPTRCIITFDGKGGSKRRRDIYEDYKKGRKSKRNYNRAYEDMEDAEEAMEREIKLLGKFLKTLPVTVVSVDYIEADDSIAYISKQIYNESGNEIYIMSSDKDFLQLVSDRIKVWAPQKQEIYDEDKVVEEKNYPPQNYLITRLIEGDKSDNISGVYGIGEKRLDKKFGDFLRCEEIRKVDDILEYARDNKEESNTYKRIIDNEDVLRRNWKLMQLQDVNISGQKKIRITDIVESADDKLQKSSFRKLYMENKIWSSFPALDTWLTDTFSTIDKFAGESD